MSDREILGVLKRLTSESFRVRQQALVEVKSLGLQAWPALVEGSRSADVEMRSSCQAALSSLQEQVGPILDEAWDALAADNPQKARILLEQILACTGNMYIPPARLQLATAYERLGEVDLAVACLQKVGSDRTDINGGQWASKRTEFLVNSGADWKNLAAVQLLREYAHRHDWEKALKVDLPPDGYYFQRMIAQMHLRRHRDVLNALGGRVASGQGMPVEAISLYVRAAVRLGADGQKPLEELDASLKVSPDLRLLAAATVRMTRLHEAKGAEAFWKAVETEKWEFSAGLAPYMDLTIRQLMSDAPVAGVPVLLKALKGKQWALAASILAELGVAEAADEVLARGRSAGQLDSRQQQAYFEALAKFGTDATWAELAKAAGSDTLGSTVKSIVKEYPQPKWRKLARARQEEWKRLQAGATSTSSPASAPDTTGTNAPGLLEGDSK